MNKFLLKSMLGLFVLLGTTISNAQQGSNQDQYHIYPDGLTDANVKSLRETGVVRCYTVESERARHQNFPGYRNKEEFENWLAPLVEAKKQQLSSPNFRRQTIKIPIIFHVLTTGSGSSNVSAAKVQAQIDQLNIDFNDLAGSNIPAAASAEIEFIPATIAPDGSTLANPGYNRLVNSSYGSVTRAQLEGGIKQNTIWDRTKYANVWSARLGSGLLGYAQFPSGSTLPGMPGNGGSAQTDGVVITASSIGSVASPSGGAFGLGRTLTHELGHWLGLRHIWGDGACNVDDFCADTPNAGSSTSGCPSNKDSCSGGGRDQIENYMDYSNDSCMDTFTEDQVARMLTVMDNSPGRVELPDSTTGGTGVVLPVSNFSVSINCNVATFSSTATSATSYSWDFGDGNTSTQENPTHTYNAEGTYTVKLQVSNTAGTDLKENTVEAQQAIAPSPVTEIICPGESATITLPGDKGYVWYDQATGGNILGAGTTFETGVLTANKDYYVSGTSENVLEGELGEQTINASNGGNHQGGFYLVFDAAENIILRKAKVFAEGAGDRTLELKDASGTVLETKVITIPDGESVIDINLRIAAGNDLQIGFAQGANLFRSNANLSYPYIYNAFNTDIVTIKESTASTPTGFYYYLYNWEINAIGNCETEERAKINVRVEDLATPTLTSNQSTGVMTVNETFSSYKWFFNGTLISGATSNTYTATENGTYTVEVSNGTCEAVSEEIIFGALSNDSFELPLGVLIYPNPAKEVLNIKGLNTLDNVKQLKVINMLGQTVKVYNLNTVLETTTIEVSSLSNGLYFLNIDDKYTAKFVVK